jgi:YD repeat-containing protein
MDGTRTELGYDGEHRLVRLDVTRTVQDRSSNSGNAHAASTTTTSTTATTTITTRYLYDALGRRLQKRASAKATNSNSEEQLTH